MFLDALALVMLLDALARSSTREYHGTSPAVKSPLLKPALFWCASPAVELAITLV